MWFSFAGAITLQETSLWSVNSVSKTNGGVVLASGMAEYLPESDSLVSEIFERADKEMYDDKARLKSIKA